MPRDGCSRASSSSTACGATRARARSSRGRWTCTSAGCGSSWGRRGTASSPSRASDTAWTRRADARPDCSRSSQAHRPQAHPDPRGLRGGEHDARGPLSFPGPRARGHRVDRGAARNRSPGARGEARAGLRAGGEARSLQTFAERAARRTNSRVTLIAPDGRVLADSERRPADVAEMENHAARPEVRAALNGSAGRDVRRSGTLGTPLIYVAVPVSESGRVVGALRLAAPLEAATPAYESLRGVMLAGGAVALVVALGIGLFVAGRVTRPVVEMEDVARQMSEGNFRVRASVRSPDEIGTLGRSLNVMAGRLREKIDDLEREQAKATAILDAMVEGVIATDGHDHIILLNERARGIFGLGQTRVERRPLLEVIRNVDLHGLLSESRAAADGEVVSRELKLPEPSERVLQVHAVPLRFTGDEPGVVIILHDITELRRLEQVRTEFVANVSHELRTPLTAIQGYLETLLDGALEEPQHARKFLEIVFRHTERLGRLTDDLTDLSNIELGRISLRIEPTDLTEVTESALAIIQPRAGSGRVTVKASLPADMPEVLADRDRLAQILINLWVEAQRLPSGMVEVAVRDTGVGVPKADLPRLTERFYRVDKARSRELGGTGLGLAIVKHLVLAHGGDLGIESELWKGTTVRFTLPTGKPT
ncbi:MAG: PAS domain-containing sensor histidine kinase [Candidatus Rokuibacteriota bacterium]|nr:MAG: PAS domain-containing sensor histidine kinase [Candidatus Rokubacteria bacterium]